ncbi:Phosphatidylinositol transfer protein 2 [Zancudomyces culisetae]|uniref:Phosphatidylinositol transfer protein 2 n=1 Tax=Zancudomyces culisetae TaxID=1213189 RepID=A0A1R1PU74_ZANCU|nr:Phosphatidylinositol transfer protein 2 [Zancudomyces culisetae]|eukprot:OMH84520.1 Phosphatidylinositol transfer protein 2 [Zancudomyces culisetae]
MVYVKEYRIVNNLEVKEYEIAQLYAVAKMSLANSGGGEGVEVVKNEPFENENGSGQYTYKIYHLASKVPMIVRAVLPASVLQIHEESWNGYPHCKTVVTNPFMGKKFKIITESMHLPDRGETENALNVAPEILKIRKIDNVDITLDSGLDNNPYVKEEDPKLYKSEKTGRGPLTGSEWRKTCEPVMTCYKLVTAEFIWFGLQGAVETMIHKMMRALMVQFHRRLYSETDEWYGMTMEELRNLEDKTTSELEQKRKDDAAKEAANEAAEGLSKS